MQELEQKLIFALGLSAELLFAQPRVVTTIFAANLFLRIEICRFLDK